MTWSDGLPKNKTHKARQGSKAEVGVESVYLLQDYKIRSYQ